MKTRYGWGMAVALVALSAAPSAFGMAGEHGKGDPAHPIGNSTWPEGTDALANRADRIGGYWINSLDTFYYAGAGKTFNEFLRQYAKVKGAHTLVLQSGSFAFSPGPPNGSHYDWEMDSGAGMATVVLPVNGSIPLRNLRVPRNINVCCEGTPTEEIKTFLAQRQASLHPSPKTKGARPR